MDKYVEELARAKFPKEMAIAERRHFTEGFPLFACICGYPYQGNGREIDINGKPYIKWPCTNCGVWEFREVTQNAAQQ